MYVVFSVSEFDLLGFRLEILKLISCFLCTGLGFKCILSLMTNEVFQISIWSQNIYDHIGVVQLFEVCLRVFPCYVYIS